MRTILTSIRRTPYQSLAAFLVLFFTLFLLTVLFISLSFFYSLLGYVETRPQVTVYFQNKVQEGDIFKLRNDLMSTGKVLSVKYVSKQEAFKIYKDLNKDNPLLLEMVSSDILPSSLEIYAKQANYLPQIADYVKKQPGVDEVHFQKDIVDRLLSLTNILRKTTLLLFLFLITMSIIVMTTTTLFKIALKKDEIELLQLLGASGLYIKKPFLLEGMFFGFTSAVVSSLLLLGTIYYIRPFLSSYLRGIPNLTFYVNTLPFQVWPIHFSFLLLTFGLTTLFGMTIAVIASYIAAEKYT